MCFLFITYFNKQCLYFSYPFVIIKCWSRAFIWYTNPKVSVVPIRFSPFEWCPHLAHQDFPSRGLIFLLYFCSLLREYLGKQLQSTEQAPAAVAARSWAPCPLSGNMLYLCVNISVLTVCGCMWGRVVCFSMFAKISALCMKICSSRHWGSETFPHYSLIPLLHPLQVSMCCEV